MIIVSLSDWVEELNMMMKRTDLRTNGPTNRHNFSLFEHVSKTFVPVLG